MRDSPLQITLLHFAPKRNRKIKDMKRYYNDPTPDPESSYMPTDMPTDMRDDRSIWQRIVGVFQGYKPLPWYW